MHQPLFSFFRIAPVAFAAVFVAANTGCIINASDFAPPVCADIAEVCPALVCELGNVVDDAGCEICECKVEEACDVDQAAPAECVNPRFDEAECKWLCEPTNDRCRTDDDCSVGFFCALVGSAEAPSDDDSQNDPAPPSPEGQCLPLNDDECTTDSDCDRGERCVTDLETATAYCIVVDDQPCVSDADCHVDEVCLREGNGGGAGADGGDERRIAPPDGICVPAPQTACDNDEQCNAGYHCEALNITNALIAPAPGVCALNPIESCLTDLDCLRGQRCDFDGSPANALIFIAGTCVDVSVPADGCFNDNDCRNGQHCELSFADNEPRRLAPCDPATANCDQVPVLPGICVDDDLPACSTDADCHDGDYCDTTSPANALIACNINEETGACDPINLNGVCRPREVACNDDRACAAGEFCDFGADAQRPAPPLCDQPDGNCEIPLPEGVCRAIPTVTECFSDDGCRVDEFCDFGFGPPRPLIIAVGTCQPLNAPAECRADADCGRNQICQFLDDCTCPAVCLDEDEDNVCDPCVCETARRPAPSGICVDVRPEPVTCSNDEQCAADQICFFDDTIAPPRGEANRPARTGVCKARIANPCETMRCTANSTCVVNDAGEGQCIPDQVCTGDESCSNGLVCNAGNEVCNANPACRPGEPCIDVCYGFCVAPERG